MRKTYRITLLLLIFILLSGFARSDEDIYFEISRGMEIFGSVYKEISLKYVDKIDPAEFMQAGIEGMLSTLDPYTVYIDKEMQKDVEVITSGKYGGIGATVGLRNGNVTIVDLIEGYSAQRQGFRIGDVIVTIDGVPISVKNYDEIGSYLKGKPGTTVNVEIKREGDQDLLQFELQREQVELKNLTYFGFVPEESSNAYLKLSSFSRPAGNEIKQALFELNKTRKVESVILDLRGNPGGLLDAAVDVSEKFLNKGQLVVSVRGRDTTKIDYYYAEESPAAGDVPVAVLVNGSSASASEIVAGAIQDHDRGIIVGEPSFGKGLVQTLLPLSFDTSLKLTTAKYFTPSGRCIQKVDYTQDNDVFREVIKSDTSIFTTDNNREVHAAGGIKPDTTVEYDSGSDIIEHLKARGLFFRFATMWFNTHNVKTFSKLSDEALFGDFTAFADTIDISFKLKEEKLLADLQKTGSEYGEEYIGYLNELETIISRKKENELNNGKKYVISEIKKELAARYDGRSGRVKEALKNDAQFETAYDLLHNNERYTALLKGGSVN